MLRLILPRKPNCGCCELLPGTAVQGSHGTKPESDLIDAISSGDPEPEITDPMGDFARGTSQVFMSDEAKDVASENTTSSSTSDESVFPTASTENISDSEYQTSAKVSSSSPLGIPPGTDS
ncbi:unnamed protein product [Orchesella dallaii]|uniref:Uncharacterized protein n=1 Tax=Orchesella dallaii TaxID=48710 RepID=A0ABP1PTL3_9HEXA